MFVHGRRRYIVHPGISPLVSVKITESVALLEMTFAKHSLLSVSRFHSNTTLATGTISNSTGSGCKDLRLRFIIYQFLQAMHFLHDRGLCLDYLDSNSIMLDDDMWLYIPIGMSDRVLSCFRGGDGSIVAPESQQLIASKQTTVPRPIDYYTPLTIQWISGKVSNFEYLMAVNFGAGRTMMDPLYHPILPWVTDFSGNCFENYDPSCFRDLSMTKFRLSKGDTQLETTFKHSDPPHHIPESISELTYYIYVARRTPMQVLRRVVRDVFVPEHYPSSMARIFEWTPDECIPEFFFDPSVFQSVHIDVGLQDLELPEFAPTPEEFIRYHRAVLESELVSESLHLWLDLTFGYCLQGDAAIKHMNVPLCHTLTSSERLGLDSPNVNKNPGFVMLFDRPHPKRQIRNPRMQSHVFSYDQHAGPSDSFMALNPSHYVNNSTKYEFQSGGGDSFPGLAAQLTGMKEYLSLDQHNRYIANLIKAAAKENTGLLPMVANAVAPNSMLSQTGSTGGDEAALSRNSRLRVKKSLMQPAMDPSLSKLKFLENVDLRYDPSVAGFVHNMHTQERHGKFAQRSGNNLDTVYSIDEILNDISDLSRACSYDVPESCPHSDIPLWDSELLETLNFVQSAMDSLASPEKDESRTPTHPSHYAMEDMFFAGCLIAELYSGRALLQNNDVLRIYKNGGNLKELISFVYNKTTNLPLPLRRLIVLLLHPDPTIRPRAKEILKSCKLASNDWYSPGTHGYFSNGQSKPRLSGTNDRREKLVEKFSRKQVFSPSQLLRFELLHDSCQSLFPAYFRSVYDIISAVKMAPSRPGRLQALLNKLDAVYFLPLEGVNLALFFLIEVLSDSSYFNDAQFTEANKPLLINLASRYWTAVDVLGIRLGMEATEKLLAAQVHKFISNFQNPELMPDLIESNIWSVIALRCGVKSFLRLFLPHLLTYVSASVLQNILEKNSFSQLNNDAAPLWALPEWNNKPHWLRGVPLQTLQTLQQAAVTSVVSLCDPDSLGKGITARYILPGLLSLVGNPQLAAAAFDLTLDSDEQRIRDTISGAENFMARRAVITSAAEIAGDLDASNQPQLSPPGTPGTTPATLSNDEGVSAAALEAFFLEKSRINTQEMYVVNAIVRAGMKLGEEVTAELILLHIMNVTLPELETQLNTSPKQGSSAAILEVIVMINGLLPALTPGTILHHLLLPSRISGSSVPKLLAHWPLTQAWSFLDDIEEYATADASQVPIIVENIRLFTVLHEVCRLVVSTSMMVGPELCSEYVLPSVDIFFHNFVEAYGMIHVESKMMFKAFEVGSEVYLPLVQLMGAEAFHTGVPNLNPRLELWLNAIGSSNVPPRSPPLPSNIWPDTTSETSNQPEGRRRSIMSWITGKVNSLTATAQSAAISTPGPYNQMSGRSSMTETSKSARKASKTDLSLSQAQTEAVNAQQQQQTPMRLSSHINMPVGQNNRSNNVMNSNMLPSPSARPMVTPAKGGRGDLSSAFSPTDGTELISMETPGANVLTNKTNNKVSVPFMPIPDSLGNIGGSSGTHVQIESPVDESIIEEEGLKDKSTDAASAKQSLFARTVDDEDGGSAEDVNTSVLVDHSPAIAGDMVASTAVTEAIAAEDDDPDYDFEPDSDDEVDIAAEDASRNDNKLRCNPGTGKMKSRMSKSFTASVRDEGDDNFDREEDLVTANPVTDLAELDTVPTSPNSNPTDAVMVVQATAVGASSISTTVVTAEALIEGANALVTPTASIPDSISLLLPKGDNIAALSEDDYAALLLSQATIDSSSSPMIPHDGSFSSSFSSVSYLRKHVVTDKRNPFLTYRKLMAGRTTKTAKATQQAMSAAMLLMKSPKPNRRGPKVSALLGGDHYQESAEDIESREWYHNALVWLLAGQGRWNIDKEVSDRNTREQSKLLRSTPYHQRLHGGGHGFDWNPAAQMSMTMPKITVDVTHDAGSLIHFQLQANTQWRLEESPGFIRCMVANASETLLMTCSRSGVRIWSLTSHPLSHICTYTSHPTPPFQGAFVRDGQHAITCDGAIHLWDIEYHHPLSIITNADKANGFSSFHMIPSKIGVHASIDGMGDEQLIATVQDSICYYDVRVSHQRALHKVADWVLPPIPPLPGTLYNSAIEPLHLTCATSNEHYVYAGSLTGGIWVLDRRMGRVLHSWQAHDGPILKVCNCNILITKF